MVEKINISEFVINVLVKYFGTSSMMFIIIVICAKVKVAMIYATLVQLIIYKKNFMKNKNVMNL